tara:strand:- start:1893 stop:2576 length:684 start_codon:yes stop_codon:yes gene_type:complete
MGKRILVIVAHPDDEVLGAGASISNWCTEGHEIYTLILGEGITSRNNSRDLNRDQKELEELASAIHLANNELGVKEVFTEQLPDNRFDQLDLLDIVKLIEKIITLIKPELVLTHYEADLNIDHQITARAVLTATRPLPDFPVKSVWSFETLAATEWNYPLRFSPNLFLEVSDNDLERKIRAMRFYKNELREYPHPRSIQGIRILAQNWGMRNGVEYAEAFKVLREIR